MRLKLSLKKILSVIATGALLFNALAPSMTVLAQEVTTTPAPTETASPTPDATVTPTDTTTPTPEVTTTPTETPSANPEVTATPVDTATPIETSTPEPSVIPSPTVESSATPVSTPLVTTDKADYTIGETATITGQFFQALQNIVVKIFGGSTTDNTYAESLFNVVTDTTGGFSLAYTLDNIFRPLYTVQTFDSSGTQLTQTTFTDSPKPPSPGPAKFAQCANKNPTAGSCDWIGSILQSSNSTYFEGMSVPQRIFDGGFGNGSHTIAFSYSYTKGGIHAYDFITGKNQGNGSFTPGITTFNACQGLTGGNLTSCTALIGTTENLITIPNDTFDSKDSAPGAGTGSSQTTKETNYESAFGPRQISVYSSGALSSTSISSIVHSVAADGDTGDSDATLTINFTLSGCPSNPGDAGCDVLVYFDGHLAVGGSDNTTGENWGPGKGSSNISGGPYHIKDVNLDGGGGSLDNQLQGADVLIPAVTPTITTHVQNANNTDITDTSVSVGTVVHDNATVDTGSASVVIPTSSTFTFHRYATINCTGTPTDQTGVAVPSGAQTGSANSSTFTPGPGDYSYLVDFVSGDTTKVKSATGTTCEPFSVTKLSPSISTTLSATTVDVGTTVHDSSTLTGATSNAGGTVTYTVYTDNACTLNGQSAGTKTVTNGTVPDSDGIALNSAIDYYWQAVYSGDTNNNGATSTCTDEHVAVNKVTPTLTTTASGPVTVGDAIHDVAHLSGGFGTLVGSITFDVFAPGDTTCSTPISVPPTKTVSGANDYTSGDYTTSAVGTYRWIAHYSGDSNNNAVDTACNDANESSATNKATPEILTTASDGGVVGVSISDSASVTGGFNPTGTVTFNLYDVTDASCSNSPVYTDAGEVLSAGSATSGDFPTVDAGTYHWKATYNGDDNNNSVTSACSDEAVVITKASPSLSTDIHDALHNIVTAVDAGSTVHDSATISGGFSPGGNVDFIFFPNKTCAVDTGSAAGIVALSNGVADPSNNEGPLNAGGYSFSAHYEGDGNNNSADSACEPLTVNQLTPSVTTQIHLDDETVVSGPIVLGSTIHDQATVSGAFTTPSGNVDFTFFPNDSCTPDGSGAGTITLNGSGIAHPSDSEGPLAAGSYSFIAHYDGDTNYVAGDSGCEPLTVNKAQLTITTAVHDANHNDITNGSIELGSTAHDNASISGAVSGFTIPVISFTFNGDPIANDTAESGFDATSIATVPLAAGSYKFNATVASNDNYLGDTSDDEPFTVDKGTPTVVTAIHDASHNSVGPELLVDTVHDSASVSGISNFDPTGNVDFTFYTSHDCTTGGTSAGTGVALANGVADPSNTEGPLSAGLYSFNAHYNGDNNYDGADGICEPFSYTTLTINKLANGVGTFGYNVSGPTNATPSLSTTNGTTGSVTTAVLSGSYTVGENDPTPFQFVSLACAGAAPTSPANRTSPSFSAPVGQNTICNFENTKNNATRTQGFWATHTSFSNQEWTNLVPASQQNMANWGGSCTGIIDADAFPLRNELMGGFWANIANSTAGKRSPTDKARVQLLQQLLAALLNKFGLGANDAGKIAAAESVYCNASATANQITSQVGILGNFNQSGDTISINQNVPNATPQTSKSQSNIIFWNIPKNPSPNI